jgi:hypothetical protein
MIIWPGGFFLALAGFTDLRLSFRRRKVINIRFVWSMALLAVHGDWLHGWLIALRRKNQS